MSGKELRRAAFALAEARYTALWPLLSRLDALAEERRLAVEEAAAERERRARAARKAAKRAEKAARKAAAAAE